MPRVCTICGDPRADEIDRQWALSILFADAIFFRALRSDPPKLLRTIMLQMKGSGKRYKNDP
jgi:hypothetical protein